MLDIGAHVGRSSRSVADALGRLEELGHIKRIGARRKGARSVYRLTPEGKNETCSGDVQKPHSHGGAFGLPDMFRSSYFGDAGRLHQAAPKGELLTQKQIIGLGIVRTRATLLKCVARLSELPAPLISVHPNPAVRNGKFYEFHELTEEAERINIAYLATVPGKEVKTRADYESENTAKRAGYIAWLGTDLDMGKLYREQVKPLLKPDPQHLGCLVFTGETTSGGYGIVRAGKVPLRAHRVAWIAQCGDLQPGEQLHHWCKHPPCASVFHLAPLSEADHIAVHQGEPSRVITPALWAAGDCAGGLEQAA